MKLNKITIASFRSVVDQVIDITDNCLGFIGLNEAGKTNVLTAIRSLDNSFKFSVKDKSKIDDRSPEIFFHFEVTPNDVQKVLKRLNHAIKSENYIANKDPLISHLTLSDVYFRKCMQGDSPKTYLFARASIEFTINNRYKALNAQNRIPDSHTITFKNEEYLVNSLKFIHEDDLRSEFLDEVIDINKEELEDIVNVETKKILSSTIPEVHFWEYKEQYLLPAEITYEEFMKEDEPFVNSAPLFNIFLISELSINDPDDLAEKIEQWKSDSSSRRKASQILTRDINKHISKIWPDYSQQLHVALEEGKITIHVSDPNSTEMNFYDMGLRSQGFKTFISFILTVSAEAASGWLSNTILILDEPETHLHPSGVKYMKEELLKLAETNTIVFYATHSVFMIDRKNLRRHIIIKKENERTKLIRVQRNNILQEEVIYSALGTALDEFSIAYRNILFEGELDLKLFSFFQQYCQDKKKNILREYEPLDGGGTKKILQFFTNKNIPIGSEWVLVLDNDSPGKQLPNKISEQLPPQSISNFKFIYYSEEVDHELEDILPVSLITEAFIETRDVLEIAESFQITFDQEKSVSKKMDEYYNRNRLDSEQKKLFEEKFKKKMDIQVLKRLDEISKATTLKTRQELFISQFPAYYSFLECLQKQLKSLR